jgi:hypothetical protein
MPSRDYYTGVTSGKRLVVLVGEAMAIFVEQTWA